jgi:hypothetical protein
MYRLSIHDVQRRLHEKNEKKLLCYDKVLEICHKRILSSTDREKTHCYFEFPEYIIGFPLFDLNACMEHCKKHLTANGFLVRYHFPHKFYISWDIDEIKEHKTLQRRNTHLSTLVAQQTNETTTKQSQRLKRDKNQLQNEKPLSLPSPTPTPTPTLTSTPMRTLTPTSTSTPTLETHKSTIPITQHIPKTEQSSPFVPTVFNSMPFDMYKKITQPLPTTPLRYDPNDIAPQSSVLDNTFFPTNFKQMLSSDIGANQRRTQQKASGKLSLNI